MCCDLISGMVGHEYEIVIANGDFLVVFDF